MLDRTIAQLAINLRKPVMGDLAVKQMLEGYLEQREKILKYKGTSAVDVQKFEYYESKLIKDDYDTWFHYYTKGYLNRVLWVLRRLKVGLSPFDEYRLINTYYDRMPMGELVMARYDKNTLAADPKLKAYFKEHGVIK